MSDGLVAELRAAVRRVLLALAIPASVAMIVVGLVLVFIPLGAPDIPAKLDTGLKRICTGAAEHRFRNAVLLSLAGVALGVARWRFARRPPAGWTPGLPA